MSTPSQEPQSAGLPSGSLQPGALPPSALPPAGAPVPHPRPPYPPQPHPLSPAGEPLAEFGDRLVAYLLDRLIIGAASLVLMLPVFVIFFRYWFDLIERLNASGGDPFNDPASSDFAVWDFMLPFCGMYLLVFAVTLIVSYVYEVEMMFRTGQTVGKRLMKIRVVPLDPARPLTRGMAAKRYLVGWVVGILVPFFNYLDGLWQLWDKPYRQCLHDRFAETTVVKPRSTG